MRSGLTGAVLAAGVFSNPGFLVTYALVQAAVLLLGLRLLDPYEREPLVAVGLVAAWGATGAAVISLAANQAVRGLLPQQEQVVFGTTVSAPVVEELAKFLALLVVAVVSWWASSRVNVPAFEGVTDGLVYGAAVGFGFAFTEDVFYLIDSARSAGLQSGIQVFIQRRDFFGPQSLHHPLFTAAAGAGLGLATWGRSRRWRVGLPAAGLLVAILVHAVNNGLAEAVLALRYGVDVAARWVQDAPVPAAVTTTGATVLRVMEAADYAYLLAALAAVLLWQRYQRRIIFSELGEEVASGLISNADRRVVSRLGRRTSEYWYLLRHGDLSGWVRLRRFHHAVVQLALVKWRVRRFSGHIDQIRECRRRLASIQEMGSPPGNLVLPRNPLVGREREVSDVAELFRDDDVPWVTLTGPPGVGRTRLALEVAATFSEIFAGGAFFVGLAADTQVLPLVARTLGIKELPEHGLLPRLAGYLRDRQVLLVLDDLDRAAPDLDEISELLRAAPRLQVLATSVQPLGIPREHPYRLPRLSVPETAVADRVAAVEASDAGNLLLLRVRQLDSYFRLDDDGAAAAAGICRALDGLPLGIELAAARISQMGAEAVDQEIAAALRRAVGGSREPPSPRQRITAVLDWTCGRLAVPERLLLERMSVFADGCSLEAVEAVCEAVGAGGAQAESLTSLVATSLVRQDEGPDREPRFNLLATVRDYGHERLSRRDEELGALRRAHARYYLALAERADAELQRGEVGRWTTRLDREHRNLAAALAWSAEDADPELPARLATALEVHWEDGLISEGRRWLERALQADGALPPPLEAKATCIVGTLALLQADLEQATAASSRALARFRSLDDQGGAIRALWVLAWGQLLRGSYEMAAASFEESARLAGVLADEASVAQAVTGFGRALAEQGEMARADEQLKRGLSLRRLLGASRGVAHSLATLGRLALIEGRHRAAVDYLDESIARSRELGDFMAAETAGNRSLVVLDREADRVAASREIGERVFTAESLHTRALVAFDLDDLPTASVLTRERLVTAHHRGDRLGVAESLEAMAAVVTGEEPQTAAGLLGFAETLRRRLGAPRWRCDGPRADRWTEEVRRRLGVEAFERSREAGAVTVLEEAVAEALRRTPLPAAAGRR